MTFESHLFHYEYLWFQLDTTYFFVMSRSFGQLEATRQILSPDLSAKEHADMPGEVVIGPSAQTVSIHHERLQQHTNFFLVVCFADGGSVTRPEKPRYSE